MWCILHQGQNDINNPVFYCWEHRKTDIKTNILVTNVKDWVHVSPLLLELSHTLLNLILFKYLHCHCHLLWSTDLLWIVLPNGPALWFITVSPEHLKSYKLHRQLILEICWVQLESWVVSMDVFQLLGTEFSWTTFSEDISCWNPLVFFLSIPIFELWEPCKPVISCWSPRIPQGSLLCRVFARILSGGHYFLQVPNS